MPKYIILFLFCLPLFLKAQTSLWKSDSTSQTLMETQCNGRIFSKVQNLPSLKISKQAFEDTLTAVLKNHNVFDYTNPVRFRFIITSQSLLTDIDLIKGSITHEEIVKKCLEDLHSLWLPATQNNYIVCSYVSLQMSIIDNKLSVKIAE